MLDTLITKIKEKKSLNRLEDEFVRDHILKEFKKKPHLEKTLKAYKTPKELARAKAFKQTVKTIRNELNKTYGIFWLGKGHTLENHASTKERAKIYPTLYKKIFEITGIPNSILDLSCGLNPLSYPYMKPFAGEYTATELTKEDCSRLTALFEKLNIKGEAIQLDLFKAQTLPKADMCFLFKILDTLETKGHKFAEQLLQKLHCSHIVVSFSTTTLKDRRMNYPRRGWLEMMLKRLGWHYKRLDFENETFYIIKKEHSH